MHQVQKKILQEPVSMLEFMGPLLIDNYDSYTYNIFHGLSIVSGWKFTLTYIIYEFSHIVLTINSVTIKKLALSNHLACHSFFCLEVVMIQFPYIDLF